MQRQEEITQYEEELAALGKRERRIKELEEDEKSTGVSKQNKIANPFKRLALSSTSSIHSSLRRILTIYTNSGLTCYGVLKISSIQAMRSSTITT